MYIDSLTILSDAQSLAAAAQATSTYYIDLLATSYAHNDDLYAQFLIDTAFTVTAAASLTMAIVISNETTFSSTSTVVSRSINWDSFTTSSATTTAAAGQVLATLKLPPEVYKLDGGVANGTLSGYRYLYATYTGSVASSGGKIDCRLVKDIDMTMDKIL